MTPETQALLENAQQAKAKLQVGAITYDEAKAICAAYIDHVNAKGKEIAKKYARHFTPASLTAFMR
jgi:hypothetical protein